MSNAETKSSREVIAGGNGAPEESMGSRALTIHVRIRSGEETSQTIKAVTARALVCRCFAGRHLSVTCRKISGDESAEEQPDQAFPWPGIKSLPSYGTLPLDEPPTSEKAQRIAKSTDALVKELWTRLEIEK
ncbi:MAG TPA: hypothetical protein VHG28_10450, partial [Longimicrobiaceae bacterium]|nr:hypothetical protein [Longimicrobiaceae bacterium]